eukprot:Skav234624  [mRNA]  locus=scaffold171:25494:34175:- [translate_table: standard]
MHGSRDVLSIVVKHCRAKVIGAWIDEEFPTPPLRPAKDLADQVKACGVFPDIAQSRRCEVSLELVGVGAKLDAALLALAKCLDGPFLHGTAPGLLDCDVLPKLHVLSHATSHYKGFSLDDVKDAHGEVLRGYWSPSRLQLGGLSTWRLLQGALPLGLGSSAWSVRGGHGSFARPVLALRKKTALRVLQMV